MGDITLTKLGYTIMSLYEVRNCYSYEFRIDEFANFIKRHPEYVTNPELLEGLHKEFKKLRYGIVSKKNMYTYKKTDGYGELLDATSQKLMDIIKAQQEEITFSYDPEINWTFKLEIEKVFTNKNLYSKELPKVLEGSGFGIIEDLSRSKRITRSSKKIRKKWMDRLSWL